MSGVRRTYQPSALQRRTSVIGLWALVAIVACLNPMPEEFPSEHGLAPAGFAGSAAGPTNGGGDGAYAPESPGMGGGAGTGGSSSDPGAAGAAGAAGASMDEPDSSEPPDAGVSSPADAGGEVDNASP
jgi:hypothetical protein